MKDEDEGIARRMAANGIPDKLRTPPPRRGTVKGGAFPCKGGAEGTSIPLAEPCTQANASTPSMPRIAPTDPGPGPHATPPSLSELLGRGALMAADCPSRDVLKHLTSRWGVLVLIALQSETLRFGDLRRRIGGVSERMLAQTLQWLERDGMVDRRAYRVVPPHVEYSLTPLGCEAAEKVSALADWIEVNLPRIAENWPQPER